MTNEAKKNHGSELYAFLRENLFQLLGVVAVVLNLWLTYKLTPLATNVELINQRVYAIEQSNPITDREFSEITRRLARLEEKIDTYILNR